MNTAIDLKDIDRYCYTYQPKGSLEMVKKKAEFLALVAEKTNMTKENANKSVDAFIEVVTDIGVLTDNPRFFRF